MQSTFATSRIFNDQDGWYITMRESDATFLSGSKYKIMGVQHLMGPFPSRTKVEEWLEAYLSMHAQNRNVDNFIPDSIDTHH